LKGEHRARKRHEPQEVLASREPRIEGLEILELHTACLVLGKAFFVHVGPTLGSIVDERERLAKAVV
jgi:hypothetical protein